MGRIARFANLHLDTAVIASEGVRHGVRPITRVRIRPIDTNIHRYPCPYLRYHGTKSSPWSSPRAAGIALAPAWCRRPPRRQPASAKLGARSPPAASRGVLWPRPIFTSGRTAPESRTAAMSTNCWPLQRPPASRPSGCRPLPPRRWSSRCPQRRAPSPPPPLPPATTTAHAAAPAFASKCEVR